MAFTVQDDEGDVAGANAYLTVADFKAYHDDRGGDYSSYTDDQIEDAIVRATDYIDARFSYAGKKLYGRNQTTQWPRSNVKDCDGYSVTGIPSEVVSAAAEYAFRSLSSTLNPDPVAHESGRAVIGQSVTVGPITESYQFSEGSGVQLPRYPAADNILINACLVTDGNGNQFKIVRG